MLYFLSNGGQGKKIWCFCFWFAHKWNTKGQSDTQHLSHSCIARVFTVATTAVTASTQNHSTDNWVNSFGNTRSSKCHYLAYQYISISHILLQLDTKTNVECINNANSSDHRHSINYLRKFKLLYQNVILTFQNGSHSWYCHDTTHKVTIFSLPLNINAK